MRFDATSILYPLRSTTLRFVPLVPLKGRQCFLVSLYAISVSAPLMSSSARRKVSIVYAFNCQLSIVNCQLSSAGGDAYCTR